MLRILDRHIVLRFLTNFAILFALLFLFTIAIDLFVALDDFIGTAREIAGEGAGFFATAVPFVKLVFGFQAPRFFQFYAYLHGLVAIGAMGFTLAQMYRHRELVAMLAAGLSMHRIAMPFVVTMFAISLAQLVNQELFLPRVAPLLLRDHGEIGRRGVETFPVALTPDGAGALFQSPRFDPETGELAAPTVLERDESGRTRRRITATSARWTERDPAAAIEEGWALTGGRVLTLADEGGDEAAAVRLDEPIAFYASDLSPRLLMVQRFGQYASMLNLGQIGQMLEETPRGPERRALLRYRYSRFSSVLVNVLVMWLTLPTFLLRQPANLIVRTMMCSSIAIPTLLGAAVFMVMELPGDIAPALGVFLPAAILVPVVLAQWIYVKT